MSKLEQAQIHLLKKRLEAMALLAHTLNNAYVSDAHKAELRELIDSMSSTKGGKYHD